MITLLDNTISLILRNVSHRGFPKQFNLTNYQTCPLNVRDRPVRILGLAGRVWITVQGDPDDYLIEPGDVLTVYRHGRLVAEGLPNGSFMLDK